MEFLTEINTDGRFSLTKKMLLTGQATHKDTIIAINEARIEKYIEKPWKSEEIIEAVKELLTHYIIESGLEHEPFLPVLHQPTLLNHLQHKM